MKKLKEYLIELSLVVLGVFIAITIDDYREKSKTDAMIKSYLNVVKKDLTENMKLLDEEIFYDSIALNRLSSLRDKVMAGSYDGLDSLTMYLAEHSTFTINDTGFRMIAESGSSHSIEITKLAQLTDLFGATMTDLKFYQDADHSTHERGMAFFAKHYPHVTERFVASPSPMSDELMHAVMPRLGTMNLEREQKKKLRKKIIEVIKFVDEGI